jgi:hypothetical protein
VRKSERVRIRLEQWPLFSVLILLLYIVAHHTRGTIHLVGEELLLIGAAQQVTMHMRESRLSFPPFPPLSSLQ